ncbi:MULTISPECIES: C-terminal binding protein [Rhizobium]|uniref:C-terminal binding protein n=1 Tax=Rhizobium rhododendri TaxID=2506430 RepID=A0ABY8IMC5_9HYPH|nr:MULTISPECIES: C-terminal binding protein [Rhizobium]TQX84107.1 C-terminal binding protein [Rhizobium sp. rho-13.1]TQY06752.1 C-terminal binding protein [Rhizobium sp. rho-1.1]WFS24883.1 C-terminal binding protein [Rhizobium rhododendri]
MGQLKKYVVGITDHMIGTPDLEAEVLGSDVEIDFFGTTDEMLFDPNRLARLDALMVWGARLGARSIAHLARCRGVVRYGVGYEKIDLAALDSAGIPFANNPDYGTEEVADHAIAMIMSLHRRLWEHDARARGYTSGWQIHSLTPLSRSNEATVGVVGVGRIGTAVVNRLKPFGFRVLGYDPGQAPGHEKAVGYQRAQRLDDLLAQSDIVTLHCPTTTETRGMLDADGLAWLKPGAILVNTARGELLDDFDALEASLKSGRLRAAAIDTLVQEPPRDHPLLSAWRNREDWLAGRLVITPHKAFYSDHAAIEMRHNAAQTVKLLLENGKLRNQVTD